MKQRITDTINHKQTDLTPWNFELTSAFAKRLSEFTGGADPEDFLGNHMMRLKYKQNIVLNEQEEMDMFGVTWSKSGDGGDVGVVTGCPLQEPDFEGYRFPELKPELVALLKRKLEQEPRPVFRMVSITMCYFERAWSLRGMENLLMDMLMNESFTEELFDRILDHHLKVLDALLDLDLEGIYLGDDWGQQNGLIMGPEMWRKYIKPGMKKMFDKIKSRGKFVILHSCGDLREILPELVDMGLDVYNTVQPEIYDLKNIKKEYGKHLTFYGGISTQQFLPMATVPEVCAKTKEVLEIMGRDGGYILSPTHAVTPDIPLENILAMIETVKGLSW